MLALRNGVGVKFLKWGQSEFFADRLLLDRCASSKNFTLTPFQKLHSDRIPIPPFPPQTPENIMSVAKVIELTSSSPKGIEDAVQSGLRKCAESVKNIKGAWVNDIKVVTDGDGGVTEWRVNLRVTFVVK
jgi:dodecin